MTQPSNIIEKTEEQLSESAIKQKGVIKKSIAFIVFALLALYFASISPTITIAWVIAILVLTIYLFVFEVVAIDVAAISIMVILGLSTLLAPIMGLEEGLVNNDQLFNGFSSNAVMSIIAVF